MTLPRRLRPIIFFVDKSKRLENAKRLDDAEKLIREKCQQLGEQIDKDKIKTVDNS